MTAEAMSSFTMDNMEHIYQQPQRDREAYLQAGYEVKRLSEKICNPSLNGGYA